MKCSHDHESLSDLQERLRKNSRKVTGPRHAILDILRKLGNPISIKEIHEHLGRECDLATVYRSIRMLEDAGMVKRFDFGDAVARYELLREGDDGHHHHLICTNCAVIVEIEDCFPQEVEEQIARRNGFKRIHHKLEFFGVCPKCQ